ncbi:MAG: class I adenylate-forming enzyme family protein [Gemmatimonadota bacterium]
MSGRPFSLPHRPLPESDRPPRLARISDYPAHWASIDPVREAVVFEGSRWSYHELADRVDRCARALLACGVARGDRVATLSPPHPDFYVTFLATASIGAIWLGLNPRYQLPELEYVAGDATPRLLFARSRIGERDYAGELAALKAGVASLERIVVLDGENASSSGISYRDFLAGGERVTDADLRARRDVVGGREPCLIVYTSGTTGKPKGAVIHHYGLVHVARVQHAIWPVPALRVVNNLPINHIGCVGDITCDTLVPGGTIVFQEQFDPDGMLRLVEEERLTFFGHVPTVLQLITVRPAFDRTDFSSVDVIIWEGAAAPPALVEKLRTKCPALANAYGMTETVGSVTFTFDTDDPDVLADSIGWPVPEYGVRIADQDDRPVEPGQPGEIQVHGDFMTVGYWQRPEATADLFTADRWLRTGDLAVERPDGAYKLIGRLKEMFKSGGYNVYPREIEQVLEEHPAVGIAAVLGVPDPLYQEVGHAFILLNPGSRVSAEELRIHCRSRLANYKVPKHYSVETALPMLPIGKVDKQALKLGSRKPEVGNREH